MALSDNNSTLLEDLYGQIAPPRYCTADCIDAPRVVSSRRALSGLRLDWAKGGSGPGGGGGEGAVLLYLSWLGGRAWVPPCPI